MPRVSVVIPNYNHARFLDQRLRSVLDQTYRDFEIVLLDDASSDDSRAVIERYLATPNLRFLPSARNSGSPFKQWNRGVSEARGELVWIAESDDFADPRLLSTLVDRLDRHPEAGLACAQSWTVDAEGQRLHLASDLFVELDRRHWAQDFIASGREECARYLLFRNTIPNASAVVFRRALYEAMGGADEEMRLCGDWMAWAGLLLRSDLAFVAEPLNFHRTHPAALRSTTQLERSATEGWKVVARILSGVEPAPEDLRRLRARLANEWASVTVLAHKRTFDLGRQRFAELRRFDPFFPVRAGGQVLRYAATAAQRRLGAALGRRR